MTDRRDLARSAKTSRRGFMTRSSILVGGAMTGTLDIARSAHAAGSDEIKIGLVGCGRRGIGAAIQALGVKEPARLVALGDVFADQLQKAYRSVKGKRPSRIDVPPRRRFAGLDAYQQVLESDVDLVILAAPPGFRPLHFEAAVAAGKHVFMEKPVAVDAPGVRRILVAGRRAKKKNLAAAVGLQRRHERAYREMIDHLHRGAIGEIILARAYWNSGGVWTRPRKPRQTELEYQLRNWYYFDWLSGDHIVEQHVQNLDVVNWLKGGYPIAAQGQGGREVRRGADHGQIFDHHFVEFTYADGSKLFSQCRHIKNCWNNVSEHAHGTRGTANISTGRIYDGRGKVVFRSRASRNGHDQEQQDLLADLHAGLHPNEVEYGAGSTMTAILGRMAARSGRLISWDEAIRSEVSLADVDRLASLDAAAPLLPDAAGRYATPAPGARPAGEAIRGDGKIRIACIGDAQERDNPRNVTIKW